MGIDAEMLVKTTRALTDVDVRHLSWDLGSRFGSEVFWIEPPPDEHHAASIVTEYTQDGPTLYPAPGETFVRVWLWTRYYGAGYERGDLPLIIAVARYVEEALSPCAVYYGGDSSGVCAAPFDAKERDKLWKHFVENGHWPYESYFGKGRPKAPVCDMCDHAMVDCGGGGNVEFYYCLGCGRHTHIAGSGKVIRDDWKREEW